MAPLTQAIRIVADDLTGAVDCLAPLVHAGDPGLVLLDGGAVPAGHRAVAWDAGTRVEGASAGARRRLAPIAAALGVDAAGGHEAGGQRASGTGPLVIQKVDSRGRGHIARDVSVLRALLGGRRLAVVCTAFPAQGRYFRDGATVDAATGAAAVDLAAAFGDLGLGVRLGRADTPAGIAAEIRAAAAAGADALLCDGRSVAQMQALAAALLRVDEVQMLAVASAGLTTALAALAGLAGAPAGAAPRAPAQGMAFVLGSAADPTRWQATALAAARGIPFHARTLADWQRGAPDPVADDVIWAIARPPAEAQLHAGAAQAMVTALMPQLRGPRALLLSGGDTARAVLEGAGLDRFEVLGAVEPGLCHGRSLDTGLDFYTKSGGFGDEATLIRLYDLVRQRGGCA